MAKTDSINPVSPARPNVLWIFGDQHRAQATGYALDPNANTPNIDNLAASGMNFARAISGFPLCCPARGSLLTGRYPHHVVPGHEHRLPPEQSTIANVFNDEGYHTAYFGKWHLDGFHERNGRAAMHIVPPGRRGGFQEWIGYENNNSQWDCWVHGGQDDTAFQYRLPGFETDELTNLLIQYIRNRADQPNGEQQQPFFSVLSVQPPHDPYIAPSTQRGRYKPADIILRENVPHIPRIVNQARVDLAGYYTMIENLDYNVGRIMDTLRQTGLLENTHVIFFSDHGDMHGSHGQFRKMNPYEEAIRVPFIVSGEKSFYDGRKTGRTDALLNHVDVAPTTLGLCGITKPSWMEGTDYSAHRLASHPTHPEPDSAYLQSVIPTKHGNSVDRPWRGIVTRDGWKYVVFEGVPWLMFNLNEDPYEQVNLAHNTIYLDMKKKLNDRLRQWIHDTNDVFQVPEV
ncbi:sulfatase [Alicyclobacillus fodiniaquatilis]|uniref:Sulfatase n=1 Tax=Alicyclobacillus fodiniaquatilis TaxID=1661150 RepID=A0ABW4JHW2_9BACL